MEASINSTAQLQIISMVMEISSEAQVSTESVEMATGLFNLMETPIGDQEINILEPMETTTLETETDLSQVTVMSMPEIAISSEALAETTMWEVEILILDPMVT
jgi:hypothetical protein